MRNLLQHKIDNLNKPKGSLGRLESLALQVGLIQQTLTPTLNHPCHILFGADHGIEREGVSVSPREVTWQQMINFGRGGGGVNMFCRQHGFKLRVVDVGVDYDFSPSEHPHIIDRKIGYGTRNFLYEPAMTADEYERTISIGADLVDECYNEGCNVICFGEMGIGNTSPSSIWMHLLADIPLSQCIGAGSGLNSEGMRHKYDVLSRAVEKFKTQELTNSQTQKLTNLNTQELKNSETQKLKNSNAQELKNSKTQKLTNSNTQELTNSQTQKLKNLNILELKNLQTQKLKNLNAQELKNLQTYKLKNLLTYFGGFEMVAALGGMMRAADHRMIILVDGFIMSACMLAASKLRPETLEFAIFGHCGDESGHRLMLNAMNAEPLLSLGLRLGEGTGAICAYPILQSAVNMINEMDNFDHAEITKYF